ncbi:hypothetical protein [Thermobispora bispora]|jgi:hypothetical protein|uniref:hypothetical protein n=1 Tax=Thermobispora bispora TaxID=2006 RepID=UPI0023525CFA|nr:hypothetical protein [Actinomycetales bacterium]MBX6167034.1 hypothetical protein [Thermobispora bispora]
MNGDTEDGRFLRLSVDVLVEVRDLEALRSAAVAEIRKPEAGLSDEERQEQIDLVNSDETGAAALQWLVDPEHVLGLVGHVAAVEPREAMLGVEPSAGTLEEGEEDEPGDEQHDHDGYAF